jgi:drug/metabolite transporter (DMT)-like permease
MYVLLAGACYGTISTITKLAYLDGFTPAEITFQVVVGCFLLWLLSIRHWKQLRNTSKKTLGKVLLSGVPFGFTEVCYTFCLDKIPATIAVILLFQSAWMTQIVEMAETRTWLKCRRWFALITIMGGTFFASGVQRDDFSELNMVGVFLGLGSAVSFTISQLVSRKVAAEMQPTLKSAIQVSGTSLIVLSFVSLFLHRTIPATHASDPKLWFWLIQLALTGVVCTHLFLNKGAPHISSGWTGMLTSIELPMVMICAALFLDEQVTLIKTFGAVAILVGIALSSIDETKETKKNYKCHAYESVVIRLYF